MKKLDEKLLDEIYDEYVNSIDEVRYSQDVLFFDNIFGNMGFIKEYLKKNYQKVYDLYKDTMNSDEYRSSAITKKEKYLFIFEMSLVNLNLLEKVHYDNEIVVKDRINKEKNLIDLWIDYVGGDDSYINPYGELFGILNPKGEKIIKELNDYKKSKFY